MLARWKGEVTTHATGFVASIATVILMAGKKVAVDENCFLLLHNPWTFVEGNANDLEKEIGNLNKCKSVMMDYYKRHCKIDDATLDEYLNNETWFTGKEFADAFDVELLACDEVMDIAAKFDLSKYKNIPRGLTMKNEEKIEEEKISAKAEETSTEKEEEKVEEKTEEKKEEKEETELERLTREIDELKKECEALKGKLAECEKPDEEEKITKAECENRISGIQSSMQKQINAYADKVKEFEVQIEAKDKELTSYKNEIISLKDNLDKANGELSKMASALEEKTNALDMLNVRVNAKPDEEELLTLKEVQAKYKGNPKKIAEIVRSGKFVRN